MFPNIQIDLLILKTYDGQFTLTTKKSLYIMCKASDTSRNVNHHSIWIVSITS